ncbi:uncharacterized protein LOC132257815 [Phlebotomus argentipes]|uniref:uncharacterized protein LOC132257815 n=1 Tax=Phlebotomus argentipes TaxID=94469 RepID=UPI0028936362|nr:uncharacterized protein LOC132257815 [Phlebotomus argentipes]
MAIKLTEHSKSTDTVKRGASPAMSLSSVASASTVRLRESGSSHSVKQPMDGNGRPQKNGTTDINPSTAELTRSGFHSTESSLTNYLSKMSSASSYMGQQFRSNLATSSADSSFLLRNQIMSSLGNYQFPSTSLSSRLTDTTSSVSALASEYLRKTQLDSSIGPTSRAVSSVTGSPLSMAKSTFQSTDASISGLIYATSTNGDTSTSLTDSVASSSGAMLYGTLPKTGSPYSTRATANGGTTSPYSSATNSIDLFGASSGNGFTYGTYRVQYSSTNPFLPTYNPAQCETSHSAIPTITISSKDAAGAISTTASAKIDTE